jgi:hypothetical protein
MKGACKISGTLSKDKTYESYVQKEKRYKLKAFNLFNNIRKLNQSWEREGHAVIRDFQNIKQTFRYIVIKTLSTQNLENVESCKRSNKSHIKANPSEQ